HAIGTSFISEAGELSQIGSIAFCDMTVFSFHPVKTIAMGEGGAVTTNDPEMAQRLVRARNHGMTRRPDEFVNAADAFDADGTPNPWYYECVEPEFNWRANDIQCALGLSQLGKLGRFVTRRRALAAAYDTLLSPLSPLVRPAARTHASLPAWHLYAARIDFARAGISRATVMRELAKDGIGSQVHYFPLHRQPYYRDRYSALSLPGADRYYERALSLPLFASMSMADVGRVADTLGNILGF
ncbi:MAG: DegT/DnrJ/EryC1/StrS family aminotransferase, partial [Rhizomicrobium sp.]